MIIKNTKKNSFTNGLNILVYGDSGAGKTRLCATTGGNPLIISAESGLLSLREYDLPYIEIKSLNDLIEAYQFVKSEKAKDFDWICIDSISEIGEICLSEEIEKTRDKRNAYGELSTKVINIIKSFRDLQDKNIYMTAKLTQEKDEYTGSILFSPMLPGRQLGFQIPYLFDEFFFLRTKKNEDGTIVRYLLTSQNETARAKDRSGALDVYERADLSLIKNKILNEEKPNE